MSTRYHATVTQHDLAALDAQHAEEQRQNRERTPRLLALCDALDARERDLYSGGRVIQSGELLMLLTELRRGLGHACYEITAEQDASLRRAWGLVASDREERIS